MATKYNILQRQFEDHVIPKIIAWLQRTHGFTHITDVRKLPAYQKRDIDLIADDIFTIEVKVRRKRWNDIAIETLSNVEQKTPGWIYFCEADFLAYVYYVDGAVHGASCLLSTYDLKTWFHLNKHRYAPKKAPNPPPQYHTQFYPIPLADIPAHVFYGNHARRPWTR